MQQTGEIILYQPEENVQLEVRLEEETVWLTQAQMSLLFETTRNNITLHIGNIFKERELDESSVCKESLLTASDGKTYKTKIYNLDVIISVGYRVKSQRGIQFRQWANKVLKDYLLKGYALNQRLLKIENQLENQQVLLAEHSEKIDFFVRTSLPPAEGIFFEGQVFDAHVFVSDLVRNAKKSIVLIDNYLDDTVLKLLDKRATNVKATAYTRQISPSLQNDINLHNAQYEPIDVVEFANSHDRFLMIDETVYHIGASMKDLGKKWFAFSKMEITSSQLLSNQTETLNDVTAHAEMLAITAAANALGAKYLDECTLYVTLEPCPMCAGALCHAHIGKIVWAADDPKNGFSRFGKMLHSKTKTETGVMHDECLALLTEFFKKKR